jgi:alpha-1,6-mannosyltransferase
MFTAYVVRLIRSGDVDLLRGHSVRHAGPSLLLGRALTRSKLPIVLHHHHLDTRWRSLDARVAARADAVITVSEHSRRELIEAGVRADRVHVVYEGVARPPATEGWPDAWPASSGVKLLCLGRLEPRKRPEVAIDALDSLRRDGVDASLVIAGEGPSETELRRRAAGLPVTFTGRVSEPDKWRLYDSADVLLFASTLEGFGLVAAEAQSRGVPVVAAAGTATAEIVVDGATGFLTQPNGEAFARAVRRLRPGMAAAARESSGRFDWDACAAGVAELYRQLARR